MKTYAFKVAESDDDRWHAIVWCWRSMELLPEKTPKKKPLKTFKKSYKWL